MDRHASRSAGALVLLGALLCGCRAGYHPPATRGQLSYGSSIVSMGGVDWDLPARDLDRVLGATDAGRILEKSLNAHGGWDRWRSLTHVGYRRLRVFERAGEDVLSDGAATDGGVDPAPDAGELGEEAAPEARDVVFDPRHWGGARDEDAAIFSLPFLLLRGGYTQEYVGAESDITQEEEFEKIRFVRAQDADPSLAEELVVYFDSSSGLLKQILMQRADDEWLLVRLSGWETVGELRVATRRKAYRLEQRFRRVRPESLVWSDTLVDLDIR